MIISQRNEESRKCIYAFPSFLHFSANKEVSCFVTVACLKKLRALILFFFFFFFFFFCQDYRDWSNLLKLLTILIF